MTGTPLSDADAEFLREAAAFFENPGFLMKVADTIGVPLQGIARHIPPRIARLGDSALRRAMEMAVGPIPTTLLAPDFEHAYASAGWTGFWHRLAATMSGGVGGALGWPGLVVELPLTTGILFRSIASIAGTFGENVTDPEVRLECLSVFSLGGPGPDDDAMDASYISSRVAMSKLIRDATVFVGSRTTEAVAEAIAKGTAPALVSLINSVASRFNVVVSQKFFAQSVPLIGGGAGAMINNAFAGHFNTAARFHFGIRRLQRIHGSECVYAAYQQHYRLISLSVKKIH